MKFQGKHLGPEYSRRPMRSSGSSPVTVNKALWARRVGDAQPMLSASRWAPWSVSWQHPFLESLWAVHQLQHHLGGDPQDGEHLPQLAAVPGPRPHVRSLCSALLHDHLVSEKHPGPCKDFLLRKARSVLMGGRNVVTWGSPEPISLGALVPNSLIQCSWKFIEYRYQKALEWMVAYTY